MSVQSESFVRCLKHLEGIALAISYCQDDKLSYYVESLREEMIGHPRQARGIQKVLAACAVLSKEVSHELEELDLE